MNEDQNNKLSEVHDSVIKIEEHLKRLNGSVERHQEKIQENTCRIDNLESDIDKVNGSIKTIVVLVGIVASLAGIITLF